MVIVQHCPVSEENEIFCHKAQFIGIGAVGVACLWGDASWGMGCSVGDEGGMSGGGASVGIGVVHH